MKKTIKRIVPFLLILAMLFTAVGCRKNSASNRKTSGAYVTEPAAYAMSGNSYGYSADMAYAPGEWAEVDEEAAVPEPGAAKAANGQGSALPEGRKIIRNAEMKIQTREYDTFMADLNSRIAANGGYIENSYASGNSYSTRKSVRSANLTVRIPASNLDVFLDGVCTMGNVLYKNVFTNDVTANYVDTEARLSALKTERETLMGLLEKADKMEDIIVIYERISDVTYQIESYESRKRTFDDQIAYSTVTINVTEVERETVVVKETAWQEIGRRISENLQDIGDGCKSLFVWFVSSLPSLLLFALFVLVLVLIVRAIVKKSRKKRAEKEAAKAPAAKKTAKKAEDKPAEAPAENAEKKD